MRITINQDLKIIQIWVTQKENNSTCFNEKVRKAVASLPNCEKFKTVIYVSGTQSLVDSTYDILKRNRLIPIQKTEIIPTPQPVRITV